MNTLINTWLDVVVMYLYNLGPVVGVLIIVLEAVIPILPLGLFITVNIEAFGVLFGFLISWLSTVVGCMLAYKFSFFLAKKHYKKKGKQLSKVKRIFENITLSNLVLLISIPFFPSFLINIAAGYYKVNSSKFLVALLIGKLSVVYFWGYVGATFIESITDLTVLIRLFLILGGVFVISKLVSSKINIDKSDL